MPEEDLDEEVIDDEEADVPEDLEEEDLEVLDEEEEDEALTVEEDDLEVAVPVVDPKVVVAREADEEEDDDDDDEDTDDVEASLDVILKERMVVADDEDDEEEMADGDDRGEMPLKVLPKQPGEFVCQSCFLVKHPSQLSDRERMFCRDCV